MRVLFYSTIFAGMLLTQGVFGMQEDSIPEASQALQEFCADASKITAKGGKAGEAVQTMLSARDTAAAQQICDEANHPKFFDIPEVMALGTFKNRALKAWCVGYRPDRESTKGIQGAKKTGAVSQLPKLKAVEPRREKSPVASPKAEHLKVKLRPVSLEHKKGQSVEEDQRQLKAAEEAVLKNAELLGKKAEYAERIAAAQAQIVEAEGHYNNLAAAIAVMREDMKGIHGFQHFNPQGYDQSSAEEYLVALEAALPQENQHILDHGSREQLSLAGENLKQARRHYELARRDLQVLNEEMIKLTHL